MSIETYVQKLADSIDALAVAVNIQNDLLRGCPPPARTPASPPGEVAPAPAPAPVAQVVDLSTMPQAQPQPGFNGAEVVTPVAPSITKEQLWDQMVATYNKLEETKRGAEVGVVLSSFDAAHIDELAPEHYPAVAAKLDALVQEVAG